jgi:hypothetical protein
VRKRATSNDSTLGAPCSWRRPLVRYGPYARARATPRLMTPQRGFHDLGREGPMARAPARRTSITPLGALRHRGWWARPLDEPLPSRRTTWT